MKKGTVNKNVRVLCGVGVTVAGTEIIANNSVHDSLAGVPWQTIDEWQQMQLSIVQTFAAMGDARTGLKECVQQIDEGYAWLDTSMEDLASGTCTSCVKICCTHATVWYDLKDLLYYFLKTGVFPEGQISKTVDGVCSNLAPTGCTIIRSLRPFICTWYLCPEQKSQLQSQVLEPNSSEVVAKIKKLQADRTKLENMYVEFAVESVQ